MSCPSCSVIAMEVMVYIMFFLIVCVGPLLMWAGRIR